SVVQWRRRPSGAYASTVEFMGVTVAVCDTATTGVPALTSTRPGRLCPAGGPDPTAMRKGHRHGAPSLGEQTPLVQSLARLLLQQVHDADLGERAAGAADGWELCLPCAVPLRLVDEDVHHVRHGGGQSLAGLG